ncbi:MAG: hypothetical protein AB8B93_12865 [Pseudomonadales bacterium]
MSLAEAVPTSFLPKLRAVETKNQSLTAAFRAGRKESSVSGASALLLGWFAATIFKRVSLLAGQRCSLTLKHCFDQSCS